MGFKMLKDLPPDQLNARCCQSQPDRSHEPYCFELFRRAISRNCPQCWDYLYARYSRLVWSWVLHSSNLPVDLQQNLVQDAFIKFIKSYTPQKLDQAHGLGNILAYLKLCVMSAIQDDVRKERKASLQTEWLENLNKLRDVSPPIEEKIIQLSFREKLAQLLKKHCQDECDYIIVQCIFIEGQKPQDLVKEYPGFFRVVNDVYQIKRNLLDRIHRDPDFTEMSENIPE